MNTPSVQPSGDPGDDFPKGWARLAAQFKVFKRELAEFGADGMRLNREERRIEFYDLLARHGLLPASTKSWALRDREDRIDATK